jgi:hypothetical protein
VLTRHWPGDPPVETHSSSHTDICIQEVTRTHKTNSIIIAIFICKNPDIKCILSVFPGFPFYKNKKAHKNLPRCRSRRWVFSGSPPPTPRYSHMLHSRTSGSPHASVLSYQGRVPSSRTEVHKGVGDGCRVCGMVLQACRTGDLVVGFFLHPACGHREKDATVSPHSRSRGKGD